MGYMEEDNIPMIEPVYTTDTTKEIFFSSSEIGLLSEMVNGTTKIDKDSAIKVALKMIGYNKPMSKSGVSVTAFGTPSNRLTKYTNPIDFDTTLYVINSHNGGFAVVSADVRIPEQILAFSNTGNLLLDNDNPAFTIFLNYAKDYAASCIFNTQEQQDSIENSIYDKIGINPNTIKSHSLSKAKRLLQKILLTNLCNTQTTVETTAELKPLLNTNWYQTSPYNEKVGGSCPDSTKYKAGCVAVATAQLITYWRHPQMMNNIIFNWNMLNNETKVGTYDYNDQAATLIKIVGQSIKTDYGCSNSSADPCSSLHLLWYLGYKVPTVMSVYKYDDVINNLNKRWPVFMSGHRTNEGSLFFHNYKNGHQWLVDGYVNQKITARNSLTYVVVEYDDATGQSSSHYEYANSVNITESKYIHINWGWEDTNGYFCKDVFDVNEKYILGSDGKYIRQPNNIKDRNYKFALEYAKDLHFKN